MVGITRRKVIIVTTNSRKEKIPEPTVPQGTADFFFWRAKCHEFNQISWCAQNAHLSREKHSERVLRPSCNKGCQLVHESLGEKREVRGLPLYSKHKNWEPTWIQGSRPRRSWKMYKVGFEDTKKARTG